MSPTLEQLANRAIFRVREELDAGKENPYITIAAFYGRMLEVAMPQGMPKDILTAAIVSIVYQYNFPAFAFAGLAWTVDIKPELAKKLPPDQIQKLARMGSAFIQDAGYGTRHECISAIAQTPDEYHVVRVPVNRFPDGQVTFGEPYTPPDIEQHYGADFYAGYR